MEKEEFVAMIFGAVIAVFLVAVPSCCISGDYRQWQEQQKAIDAGVGYWEQVDEGPETEFVYGVKPDSETSAD